MYQLLIKTISYMEQDVNLKKDVLLDYTFVLDASGSMSLDVPEVLDELNRQLVELKEKYEQTERPCRVTIVKFDTQYEVLRDQEFIQNIELITDKEYYAAGMTALYDAIGMSVKRADARVDFKVKRGDAEALVVIFTDGGENRSSVFQGQDIKAIMTDYQGRKGWEIAFIGTDLQGIKDLADKNMRREKMRYYKQDQKREALNNLGKSVSEFYTGKDRNFKLTRKN